MKTQSSNLAPRDMFVSLWLRSVIWNTVYGSIFGALVLVLLINTYGLLVWTEIVPSNAAYNRFSSTLSAMLLYIPLEVAAGVLIGGSLGMLQGAFTGLVIGRVTMRRFYPPDSEDARLRYRHIMGRLSIIGAFFITLLALAGYIVVRMANDNTVLKLGDALLVTITVFLITYAAWCANQHVCHWYTGIEHQPAGIE